MQQALQVITAETIVGKREAQLFSESDVSKNFRTTPLSVPELQHHLLKMILCLGVAVSEESRLLSFANDVRNAKVIAADGDGAR